MIQVQRSDFWYIYLSFSIARFIYNVLSIRYSVLGFWYSVLGLRYIDLVFKFRLSYSELVFMYSWLSF